MDNEVTKLYENAGVKGSCKNFFKDLMPETCLKECEEEDYKCKDCDCWKLPLFTAEKQFYIIKFVAKIEWIDNISSIVYRPLEDEWGIFADSLTELSSETPKIYGFTRKTFEEALAKLVNDLWQDLSDTEKVEIKRILE